MSDDTLQRKIQQVVQDFICAHCHAKLGYTIQFADHSETYSEYGDFINGSAYAVVSCVSCKRLCTLLFDVYVWDGPVFGDPISVKIYESENPAILYCHWDKDNLSTITSLKYKGQIPSSYQLSKNVPTPISRMANEAANCLAVGSPHAAAVICRRILEALVRHLGITRESKSKFLKTLLADGHIDEFAFQELSKEQTLHQDIEQAKAEGKIDERLFHALNETRKWGNIGAHTDDNTEMEHVDIAKLIVLTTEIIEYAYLPDRLAAKTSELTQRRQTKKGS